MNMSVIFSFIVALPQFGNQIYKREDSVNTLGNRMKSKRKRSSFKLMKADYLNDKETVTSTIDQTQVTFEASMDTKEVPNIIKKLTIGLVIFFITVFALTIAEAVLHYLELKKTISWFLLIENCGIRYVLLCYLSSTPTMYDIYRTYSSPSVLQSFINRTEVRVNRIYEFHIKSRESLESLNFFYDYDSIDIVDGDEIFTSSFLYAMLTVGFRFVMS